MRSADYTIGVIGGTGLYQMAELEVHERRSLHTPFGSPSDSYLLGELGGRRIAFLARHGEGHRLLPSELNFRANLYGFKVLGVERLIGVSAVGSMKEEYVPGDVVVPDQFVDRTRHRPDTFFGRGLVAHVGFADPICPHLAATLVEAGTRVAARIHRGGTYLCMEGPQFSTRAESMLYRQWGVDVIGMTNLQEAKLAREAEICFATLALVTDYDCWHQGEADVSVGDVLALLAQNAVRAQAMIQEAVRSLPEARPAGCPCADALATALVTPFELVPEQTLRDLEPLLRRYRKD